MRRGQGRTGSRAGDFALKIRNSVLFLTVLPTFFFHFLSQCVVLRLRGLLLYGRIAFQLLKVFKFPALQELFNASEVLPYLPVTELIELINQSFKEVSVVTYNNERAIERFERLLENVFRLDIHMVGRLVEGQQIVILQHQLGHSQTCTLASRQYSHPLVDVLSAEQELGKDILSHTYIQK